MTDSKWGELREPNKNYWNDTEKISMALRKKLPAKNE